MGVALVPFLQVRLRPAGPLFLLRIALPRFVGLLVRAPVRPVAGIVVWRFLAHRIPLLPSKRRELVWFPANGRSDPQPRIPAEWSRSSRYRSRDHHHKGLNINPALDDKVIRTLDAQRLRVVRRLALKLTDDGFLQFLLKHWRSVPLPCYSPKPTRKLPQSFRRDPGDSDVHFGTAPWSV